MNHKTKPHIAACSLALALLTNPRITIAAPQTPFTRECDWIVTDPETVKGKHIRLNGNLILE